MEPFEVIALNDETKKTLIEVRFNAEKLRNLITTRVKSENPYCLRIDPVGMSKKFLLDHHIRELFEKQLRSKGFEKDMDYTLEGV